MKDNIDDSPNDSKSSKDLTSIADGTLIESSLEKEVTTKDAAEDLIASCEDDTKEKCLGSATSEDSTNYVKHDKRISKSVGNG